MSRFFVHHERFMIWRVKQFLEDNGIPCFIRNEFAVGGIGDLSPIDSDPEVWLVDEEWRPRAQKLLDELLSSGDEKAPTAWTCKACNEQNEASFEICWQCSAERDV